MGTGNSAGRTGGGDPSEQSLCEKGLPANPAGRPCKQTQKQNRQLCYLSRSAGKIEVFWENSWLKEKRLPTPNFCKQEDLRHPVFPSRKNPCKKPKTSTIFYRNVLADTRKLRMLKTLCGETKKIAACPKTKNRINC